MSPAARPRLRLAAEDGFSLMELMVGMTIAMIVFFAAANFIGVGQRSQASAGDRAEALGQQRVGLERITRELRQAHTAWPTGAVLEFVLPVAGGMRRVRYDCSTGAECRRYETSDGEAFSSSYEQVISDVESAAFTPTGDCDRSASPPGPCTVSIDLRVDLPDRDMPIVLNDGVHLRNEPEA